MRRSSNLWLTLARARVVAFPLGSWLALALFCGQGFAQAPSSADLQAARELAGQGLAAVQSGDFVTGDDLLSRAIALRDAPTLRLARARARSGASHVIAAAEDYRVAQRWPVAAGEPAIFAQVRRDAERELGALEARIPRLTVELDGDAAIRVGGVAWPAAAVGTARLVDPGEYRIEAIAPSGASSHAVIRLELGERKIASLRIGASDAALAAAAPTPVPPNDPPAAPQPSVQAAHAAVDLKLHDTRADKSGSDQPVARAQTDSTGPLVLGGVSVALLVASLVTGARAAALNGDYKKINDSMMDTTVKTHKRSEVVTMAWISTALMGAAFVSGGITAYMLVSGGSDEGPVVGHAQATGRRFAMQATLAGRF